MTVNRKQNRQLLAFSTALISLMLPPQAQAAEPNRATAIAPPLLLLLLNDNTCPNGRPIVIWKSLQWQRCDDGKMYDWTQAKTYCQDLVLGSYSDWRLPTKDELKDLVVCDNSTVTPLQDYPNQPYYCGGSSLSSNYTIPTIDTSFPCYSKFYWSSTAYYGDYKWGVYFFSGFDDWESSVYDNYVRCVR